MKVRAGIACALLAACVAPPPPLGEREVLERWFPFVAEPGATRAVVEAELGAPVVEYEEARVVVYPFRLEYEADLGWRPFEHHDRTGWRIREALVETGRVNVLREGGGHDGRFITRHDLVVVYDDGGEVERYALIQVVPWLP